MSARRHTFVILLLCGCSGMEPERGFDDVRRAIEERTAAGAAWITDAAEDRAADDAVAALLEDELSADEAVQIALLRNRRLQATYEELGVAQADLVQAGLLRNPVFGAAVRFGVDTPGTELDLDVTQDFLSLLTFAARKDRAEVAFDLAVLRVTAAVLDVAAGARAAYYESVAAAQTVEMHRAVVDATHASFDLATRIFAAGNSPELDLLVERDVFEQARLDLARAVEADLLARERLTALLGLWGAQTSWRAAPRLPPLPEEDDASDAAAFERRAVATSLDLAAARKEIEIAVRTLGIVRPFAWLGDDAGLGASAERDLDGEWAVGPALSVPLPLFDFGQAETGRAAARLRQAEARYHARAVEVRSQARSAAVALDSTRDRARWIRSELLPLRERIVEQTQLQYNAMQIPPFQLLEARRHQIEAGAASIEALRDYWIARTHMQRILGGGAALVEGNAVADMPAGTGSGHERASR